MTRRIARRPFIAAVLLAAAGRAPAQPRFPDKPITLIVPFAPGGIADIVARTVSQAMGESLGQSFVVDNRPSAGGIVAGQAVAKAAPDGYTLMVMSNANAVSTGLFKKLPFDRNAICNLCALRALKGIRDNSKNWMQHLYD